MFAKVNPYLRPLLDAINDMLEFEQVRRYMSNDVIEIAPLAFMRGRTSTIRSSSWMKGKIRRLRR